MKRKQLFTMVLALVMVAVLMSPAWAELPTMKMTTFTPNEYTTPDKVETPIGTLEFFDGVPIGDTTEKVYDYVDRARAVEVFINMVPAVSMYHIRQGQRNLGIKESNHICIFEQLMDSKSLVLTANTSTL
jgi:hypothetical protein